MGSFAGSKHARERQAVEAERAQVAAWLRTRAAHLGARDPEVWLLGLAFAIERGDHDGPDVYEAALNQITKQERTGKGR